MAADLAENSQDAEQQQQKQQKQIIGKFGLGESNGMNSISFLLHSSSDSWKEKKQRRLSAILRSRIFFFLQIVQTWKPVFYTSQKKKL